MSAVTIANEITARLAAISIANGYNTEIGARVYRGKRRLVEDDVPGCVLIEGDDIPQGDALRSVSIEQRYIIEAHAQCDVNNPNDMAHLLIADMKKAIFSVDPSFGRMVKRIAYKGRTISPREDGTAIVAAGIEIAVWFVEDLTSP